VLTPEEKAKIVALLDRADRENVFDLTQIGRRIQDGLSSVLSGSSSTESQAQAAIYLIREGQKSGLREIEMKMSNKAGLSLGSDVYGIPIEATLGVSGNMTIRVKYK
jgi:hypothetical protein